MLKRRNLYQIKLMDYNAPAFVSSIVTVFTEDIEEFTEKYLHLEEDEDRKNRFLRSKDGEMVTDYYSDDPNLNIVQFMPEVEVLGESSFCEHNLTVTVKNGFDYPSDYFFAELGFRVMWVRTKEQLLKLVKANGIGCCVKNEFSDLTKIPWSKVEVYGNPFWEVESEDVPDDAENVEAYSQTRLKSYVWHIVDVFESIEELEQDRKSTWLSEKQIDRVLKDLPGDAG